MSFLGSKIQNIIKVIKNKNFIAKKETLKIQRIEGVKVKSSLYKQIKAQEAILLQLTQKCKLLNKEIMELEERKKDANNQILRKKCQIQSLNKETNQLLQNIDGFTKEKIEIKGEVDKMTSIFQGYQQQYDKIIHFV